MLLGHSFTKVQIFHYYYYYLISKASFSGIRLVQYKQVEICNGNPFCVPWIWCLQLYVQTSLSNTNVILTHVSRIATQKMKGLSAKPMDKSNCIQCVPALVLLHRPPLGSHGATIKLQNNRGTYGAPRRRRLLNVCSHRCRIGGHTLHRSLWSPLQTVALYGVLRNIQEMGALLHPEPVNVTCYLTLWMYVQFIMW